MPLRESNLPGLCLLDVNAPPPTPYMTTICVLQTLYVLGRECWLRAFGVTSTMPGTFLTLLGEHDGTQD